MKQLIYPLLLILMAFACKPKTKDLPLHYQEKVVLNSLNNCIPDSANCTYIMYTYPVFSCTTPLADTLNNFVKHTLGASNKTTLEQSQQHFINDYIQFKKQNPSSQQVWYSNAKLKVVHQNQAIISMAYYMDDFTGGAHGMHATSFTNYWQKTAKLINIKELFNDENAKALNILAEFAFRKSKGLSPEADLDSAGFWFKDNVFDLNDNFKITEEGITWLFNPYEVAPYAAGIIEVFLPKNDFMPLLYPDANVIWEE